MTLQDFSLEELALFPDSLLILGTMDGLAPSTRSAHQRLLAAGGTRTRKLLEFDAPHAFVGLPPQWTFGYWETTLAPALEDTINFLRGEIEPLIKFPKGKLRTDYSIFGVIMLHAIVVTGILYVCVMFESLNNWGGI